ncbi:MAG: hypothetical protein E7273_04835 [Pseudobutyrivibrio ruminis]|nr:hypothetical protein [Pseudobutyrivibrio ruminis]
MKRNGAIELYRFIFAIVVMIYHFGKAHCFWGIPGGYLAVEYFFMLSGYFMTSSIFYLRDVENSFIEKSYKYILDRIKFSLNIPHYIIGICGALLQALIVMYWDIYIKKSRVYKHLLKAVA